MMDKKAQIRFNNFLFFEVNIILFYPNTPKRVWYYIYNNSNFMREYQQKHMIRTLVYSRVAIVILFLLTILLLRSIMDLNDKRIEVAKLRNDSKIERDNLVGKVEKAKKQSDEISTDRGFESYVRSTYPVVKEGEGVIVIYDGDKSPVSQVREDMNVWERLLVWWNNIIKKK